MNRAMRRDAAMDNRRVLLSPRQLHPSDGLSRLVPQRCQRVRVPTDGGRFHQWQQSGIRRQRVPVVVLPQPVRLMVC
jgi:hypothetical protein